MKCKIQTLYLVVSLTLTSSKSRGKGTVGTIRTSLFDFRKSPQDLSLQCVFKKCAIVKFITRIENIVLNIQKYYQTRVQHTKCISILLVYSLCFLCRLSIDNGFQVCIHFAIALLAEFLLHSPCFANMAPSVL